MMYRKRYVDELLVEQLSRNGAVLVRGPKGCGKTETAKQVSKSNIRISNSPEINNAFNVDPNILLEGENPRLIDEWQNKPALWDYVRHSVDDKQKKGQYILTGSASPVETVNLHSGVGRFGIINMRTMSSYELGYSSGEVLLSDIMKNKIPQTIENKPNIDLLCEEIIKGGWPGFLELDLGQSQKSLIDMVQLIQEVDVNTVSKMKRDPLKIRRLMMSLSRNISNEASIKTLARDSGENGFPLADDTVQEYLDALTRLMILEDLPAWSTHIRSSATLRKAKKRHFVDPSIAVASLGISKEKLTDDFNFLGFLFESLVLRDLRVYSEKYNAKIYHYRDSNNHEVDFILENYDGSWCAFEVKLGFGAIEEGVKSLLKFSEIVNTEKVGKPLSLNIITHSGYSERHPSGVNLIPLWTLRG